MKTYRIQLWSGIDPDQLSACAQYIYLACKQEFETVHAFNNGRGSRPPHFRSIYISCVCRPSELNAEEYLLQLITEKLNAYKRMTGQNGIMIDSIKGII